jgi:hypothetical protein
MWEASLIRGFSAVIKRILLSLNIDEGEINTMHDCLVALLSLCTFLIPASLFTLNEIYESHHQNGQMGVTILHHFYNQ